MTISLPSTFILSYFNIVMIVHQTRIKGRTDNSLRTVCIHVTILNRVHDNLIIIIILISVVEVTCNNLDPDGSHTA